MEDYFGEDKRENGLSRYQFRADSRYYREGGAPVCGNIDLLRIK